jgi:hypothetical protein
MQNREDLLHRTDGIFYSAPPTVFDPVIGYRWRPRSRILSLAKGELIYENQLFFNNYGYHCATDYQPEKKSARTFRIVILGDSFTNGVCMPRTWAESLQEVLRARPDHGRDVEVYAFPTDGGGLLNWYHVFMHQILPVFEFDALILGDTVNDCGNKFIVTHSTDEGAYIGFFDYEQRPVSQADFQRVFPKMTRYYDVISESSLNELSKRAKARPPAKITEADYLPKDDDAADLMLPAGANSDPESLTEWYGERRLGMLREMVEVCRQRGVPVIYYSMPNRSALLLSKHRPGILRQEAGAAAMAKRFRLEYFNGYRVFKDVPTRDIVDLHWLKYDGHWALPAANLFALKMAGWLQQKGLIKSL